MEESFPTVTLRCARSMDICMEPWGSSFTNGFQLLVKWSTHVLGLLAGVTGTVAGHVVTPRSFRKTMTRNSCHMEATRRSLWMK